MLCTELLIPATSPGHLSKGQQSGICMLLWDFSRGSRSSTSQDRSPPDVICFMARHKPRWFAKLLPDQYLPWALLGGACLALESAAPLSLSPLGSSQAPITLSLVHPGASRTILSCLRASCSAVGQGCCRSPSPSHLQSSLAVILSVTLSLLNICAGINRRARTGCLEKDMFPRQEVALGGF